MWDEFDEILATHLEIFSTPEREYMEYPSTATQDRLWKSLVEFRSKYGQSVAPHVDYFLSDILAMKGEFAKALQLHPSIHPSKQAVYPTNWRLNLKLLAEVRCEAEDLLSLFPKNLTGFGQKHFPLIQKYIDVLLDAWGQPNGRDLLRYIADKHADRRACVHYLFSGTPYLIKFRKPVYEFFRILEFQEIVNNLTRESENTVREEQGLPRVGEGWMAETELYYLLKSWLVDYRVLQHARPPWLRKQHLDIYIPDLSLAIEYQGCQHDQPVSYFGGEIAFSQVQKRDRRKARLCKRDLVLLLYAREGYAFEEIKAEIRRACPGRNLPTWPKHESTLNVPSSFLPSQFSPTTT
jgi:hypothetical protein